MNGLGSDLQNDRQILASAGGHDAGSFLRYGRVAPDCEERFGRHQGGVGARVDYGTHRSRPLRAEQLNGNDPQGARRRHISEGGREPGRQSRAGEYPVEAAPAGDKSVGKIFFSGAVKKQSSRLGHERSLVDAVNVDQEPFVFVTLKDFLNRFAFSHDLSIARSSVQPVRTRCRCAGVERRFWTCGEAGC